MHTQIHAHTYACMQARTCTSAHACTHTLGSLAQTHACTYADTHEHAHAHARTHSCVLAWAGGRADGRSGVGSHMIVGSTLDDSIGEAFDKTARLLGITKIPGGPDLER